jgi:charged multivesicular body protein 2A
MEDDEEESDEILNQVLDEIGVDLTQKLGEAPQGFAAAQTETRVPQAQAMGNGGASGGGAEDDLMARLNNLKGGGD